MYFWVSKWPYSIWAPISQGQMLMRDVSSPISIYQFLVSSSKLRTTTDFYQYGNKDVFKVRKKCLTFNIFLELEQKQRKRTANLILSDFYVCSYFGVVIEPALFQFSNRFSNVLFSSALSSCQDGASIHFQEDLFTVLLLTCDL